MKSNQKINIKRHVFDKRLRILQKKRKLRPAPRIYEQKCIKHIIFSLCSLQQPAKNKNNKTYFMLLVSYAHVQL